MRRVLSVFVGLVVFALAAPAWAGPVSELYLKTSARVHVIQGSSISRSWIGQGSEFPIAVNSTVRTHAPSGGGGSEYTKAGVFTGTTFPSSPFARQAFDAATDGTYIYTVDFVRGEVVRMDLNWDNQVALFTVFGGSRLGITYDPLNNSLWLADWTGTDIENRALDGTLLSSFTAPTDLIAGFAMDYADGTLWFGTQRDNLSTNRTFWNFSRSGALLGTQSITGLKGQNFLGGEFMFMAPEPAAIILLGSALAAGIVFRRRRKA